MTTVPRIRLRVLPQVLPIPNSLAIGVVTAGASPTDASASVTGAPPSQVLNLKLPRGPQGASLNFRGAWQTATAYAVLDTVTVGGSSYSCATAHTSGTFSTDLTSGFWSLIAQKGDKGDQGDAGPQGDPTSAGNGLTIDGTSIAIDTSVTADLTSEQTLENKTLVAPDLGTPSAIDLTNATGLTAALVQSALASLPTTLPGTSGQLWWNGGVLSLS